MASAARVSSAGVERNGEQRGVKEDHFNQTQMMNKIVGAVMEKLAYADSSKTFTPDQKNDIKRHLCRLLPVIKMPDHPTYAVMIHVAIEELNEEYGSTKESISKIIREKFNSLPLAHESFLNHHLKKLKERGDIVLVSKDCYMLPAEKVDSPSRRKHVWGQKQTQKGRGKGKPAKGNDSKASAQEQVEATEKQTKQRQRREETHYCKAFDDQAGSLEMENIQDKANGGQCQRKMEESATIAVKQSQVHIEEDQQGKVGDQDWSPKAQQEEVIKQQIQDTGVIVVPLEQKYKVPEEQQPEVTEHEQQPGQESQELIREEQHCMVIDCQVEVTEQQQQHGQKSQELLREEQHSMVIDRQNGFPDEVNVQQHEVNSLRSQNQVQAPGEIAEEQNIELTCKEDEVQVEVTEQLREDGPEVKHSTQAAQRSNMIEGKYDSADGQQNRVNGHENQKHMQDVSLIVDKQNVEVSKYQVSEEQVEMIEQKTEHVKLSKELMQQMKLIDCDNGSSKQQNEKKHAVSEQQSENQMHVIAVASEIYKFAEQTHNVNKEGQVEVTEQQAEMAEKRREYGQKRQVSSQEEQNSKVIRSQNGSSKQQNEPKDAVNGHQSENKMRLTAMVVEMLNFPEQTCNANEEEEVEVTEEYVPVTEQQKEYGKQSRVACQEEHNSKVIYCQNGCPEQQNKQQHMNEDQLQENIVSCEKQIDTKLKLKGADEHIEVCLDKVIEEQCQTNEQSFEVIEQHSQAVKSSVQLHGKVVEAILTGTKAQQSNTFSGQNRSQDQFELTSMQELLSKTQEKDVATLVNSNDSIASQKLSHHVSSNVSEMTCKLLENNIKVQEMTHKLLERNIEVQEKRNKLLEDKIKIQKKKHKLRKNNITLQEKTLQVHEKTLQVQEKLFEQLKELNNFQLQEKTHQAQEKTIQVQEKLFELLKGLKHTNRSPIVEERRMPIIASCGEKEYIDCGFPAEKKHQPEILAQKKALGSQLYTKQGMLNLCQQLVPKGQNKTVKTHRDAKQPQEQEIGISERIWELPTLEGENEELSGPVRKKIHLRVKANHETEKQLQVHSNVVRPDLLSKQPSASFRKVAEAPKCQDEDNQAENAIKGKVIRSSHHSLELTASEQSCQTQLEKQEQQLERQLHFRGTKSAGSDFGVAAAPEFQEHQTRYPVQERMMVVHKPAEQMQLSPWSQGHSGSELSLTTSMVESSPRKNQDTERQREETTPKKSAEAAGQRQLQQMQLQPRSNNLSESERPTPSNTGMPQVEKLGVEVSSQLKKQSHVGNPGVGESSEQKKNQVNCSNKRKLSTTMPDAIGAVITCERGSDQTMDPNHEVVQDLGSPIADLLSHRVEGKENPHGQRKKFKSKPTARESPDELSLSSQHHAVKPPQLNAGEVNQLFHTTKEALKEQQLLYHMNVHSCSQAASQSKPDVLKGERSPQITNKLLKKQQVVWNMKLRSRNKSDSRNTKESSGEEGLKSDRRKSQV